MFSFGLIGRIVIALSIVFALLMLLNDMTVTSVIRLTLESNQSTASIDTSAATTAFISKVRKPILIYSITAAAFSLLAASLMIHRIVVRPIRDITQTLDDVTHGKLNVRAKASGATELILLSTRFNHMLDTISQQKQFLEEQLHQLEDAATNLKNTQNDLVRAARLASVGTLASGVAHEIGNPIAGILGLLEALEDERSPKTAQTYRNLIRKEIERIDKIIRDLLSYARPDSSPKPHQARLTDVMQHVASLVRVQKSFSSIQIHFSRTDEPPLLAISTDDLTALLINLFLNAAQAISNDGNIYVSWERDTQHQHIISKDAAIIHVRDDGPGISKDIAEHIFDPFFTNRKAGGGTGLGLAICMSICDRNDARIELCQDTQKGAHFRIFIPFATKSLSS
ncbi:MAG: HAMP domain-containing protein [Deltaproteobacteria bacterium]|nr:HAMP domain-containing protein [Deltaproteobacteria bacterium]